MYLKPKQTGHVSWVWPTSRSNWSLWSFPVWTTGDVQQVVLLGPRCKTLLPSKRLKTHILPQHGASVIHIQSQNHFLSGWPCWMLLLNDVTVRQLNSPHGACFQCQRLPPTSVPGEKLYTRGAPLVAQSFNCIYAPACCKSRPSAAACVLACVHQTEWREVPPLRINLLFIFTFHFSACPDKRQHNDEARLCPLSASVMNRCMNLKKLQADGGKLYTQSLFVN